MEIAQILEIIEEQDGSQTWVVRDETGVIHKLLGVRLDSISEPTYTIEDPDPATNFKEMEFKGELVE